MSLSLSKKAINERRRRVTQREKRRRTTFVHDYVRVKYATIYNECNGFYQELTEKYPGKIDFTKTREYRRWEAQINERIQTETHDEIVTLEAHVILENCLSKPTATTGKFGQSDTETATQEVDIAAETISKQLDQTGTENIESTLNMFTETVTATRDVEQYEPSILQIAAGELLPTDPISIENMDRIVDEIIRDLERDEQVRELLDNINENDEEDEGIEINIDTELRAIVEPFDYQVEVEGEDW